MLEYLQIEEELFFHVEVVLGGVVALVELDVGLFELDVVFYGEGVEVEDFVDVFVQGDEFGCFGSAIIDHSPLRPTRHHNFLLTDIIMVELRVLLQRMNRLFIITTGAQLNRVNDLIDLVMDLLIVHRGFIVIIDLVMLLKLALVFRVVNT